MRVRLASGMLAARYGARHPSPSGDDDDDDDGGGDDDDDVVVDDDDEAWRCCGVMCERRPLTPSSGF
jgi:hypothetical protein